MLLETQFRVALFVVMALTMTVGIYHRLQAASSDEKISHREEGRLYERLGVDAKLPSVR